MRSVGVVIAACNAEDTIGMAVGSALANPWVTEVVVVSDGSSDNTIQAAATAAKGDSRLRVLSLMENVGPAEARNRAIDMLDAEFVALLDADDQFLPGRFDALFEQKGWDLIADGIVFVKDPAVLPPPPVLNAAGDTSVQTLSLTQFVGGNLSRPGAPRGEYGFLKPVISREFLLRHGLRYDSRLRLGEDYDLYARALMAGGRFLVIRRVGYMAQVRSDSLSARHRTADLEALARITRSHLDAEGLTGEEHAVLGQILRQMEGRFAHRAILDIRAQYGRLHALRSLLAKPHWIPPVAASVLRDKLRRRPSDVFAGQDYKLLLVEADRGSGRKTL